MMSWTSTDEKVTNVSLVPDYLHLGIFRQTTVTELNYFATPCVWLRYDEDNMLMVDIRDSRIEHQTVYQCYRSYDAVTYCIKDFTVDLMPENLIMLGNDRGVSVACGNDTISVMFRPCNPAYDLLTYLHEYHSVPWNIGERMIDKYGYDYKTVLVASLEFIAKESAVVEDVQESSTKVEYGDDAVYQERVGVVEIQRKDAREIMSEVESVPDLVVPVNFFENMLVGVGPEDRPKLIKAMQSLMKTVPLEVIQKSLSEFSFKAALSSLGADDIDD